MLYFNVKHQNDFSSEVDFLETILKENGVEDINKFLNPSKSDIHDPFLLKNMDRACEIVKKHIENNSNIFLYVDVDVDGVTSATIMYQFLKKLNPNLNIKFDMRGGKKHGLSIDQLEKEINLAIVPDASTEEKDDIKEWFPDCEVLFLDHHEVNMDEFNDDKWCMVNCHDNQYPNETLCGAGVVQKFVEAYCDKYEPNDIFPYDWLDLVSLGLVADGMDLRNPESRAYALQGLEDLYHENDMINALEEFYTDDLPYGRYIGSLGWVIAPKINGIIRFGQKKEIMDMVKAFFGFKETKEYQPRRKRAGDPKPEPIQLTLQEWVARNSQTVKNRQDTAVRKNYKELQEKIEKEGLDKNSFIFIDATNVLDKGTISGLVANKLASEYMRPVLLMRKRFDGMMGGSMRNYAKGNVENLKDYLNAIGIMCSGHQAAAGIQLDPECLDEYIEQANKDYPLENLHTVYEVDWEIPADEMKKNYISEVAENYEVWGNGVPAPQFAITNLVINASDIQTYGEGKFIRFMHNGVNYNKKYCKAGEYEDLTHANRRMIGPNKQVLKLTLICEFINNSYEGQTYPVANIIAFDSEVVSGENETRTAKNITTKVVDLDDFEW